MLVEICSPLTVKTAGSFHLGGISSRRKADVGGTKTAQVVVRLMIKTLIVAARDRHRLAEITQVASRFGLGILLARIGLERADEVQADRAPDLPRRVRSALEELGPTFIKLGQILATRGDLLPPEWVAELEQLHSDAPTLPFEQLRPAVEEALGQPPETAFARFDLKPIAAASMAQVHRAALTDGREVVLKIRRPGIRSRMAADLRLIAQAASIAEKASAEVRRFEPTALIGQLAEAVLEELDFTIEGRNADRLRADFAHDPRVVVPEIHWTLTSDALLVMDYVQGVVPRDGETLRKAGIDPGTIADLGADMVLDMVLINGRFHGDPHPGNLLCLPGNRIALLDLGMVGHVSPRRREEFVAFTRALSTGDPAALSDVLLAWTRGSDASRDQVQAAADRLIARHGQGHVVLNAMVADFLGLMREQGMMLPPDLLIMLKALITIDGVLSAIQPDFDLNGAIRRSALRIVSARMSPQHWGPIVQAVAWELGRLGSDAPRLVRTLIRRLETETVVQAQGNDRADAITSAARWIAAAVLVGSTLIAAAILR